MKVLLKRDVPNLGEVNEIKEVSEGYGRNYLLPRGLAVIATDKMVAAAQREQRLQAQKAERLREQSEHLAELLRQKTVRFTAKAGETGRLYGSITSKDIAQALAKQLDVAITKRQILLDQPLRDLGEHWVDLKLQGGVRAQARIVIEPES